MAYHGSLLRIATSRNSEWNIYTYAIIGVKCFELGSIENPIVIKMDSEQESINNQMISDECDNCGDSSIIINDDESIISISSDDSIISLSFDDHSADITSSDYEIQFDIGDSNDSPLCDIDFVETSKITHSYTPMSFDSDDEYVLPMALKDTQVGFNMVNITLIR